MPILVSESATRIQADVVTVLMGEMPGRGEKCENCNYFENRSRLTP